MGVGRGRVAGATIAATSLGINTATAFGSTDHSTAADRCTADFGASAILPTGNLRVRAG